MNSKLRNAILSAIVGFFICLVITLIVYGEPYWILAIGITIGSFISYYLFIDRKRN